MKRRFIYVLAFIMLFVVSCGDAKKAAEKDFKKIMSAIQKGDLASLLKNDKSGLEVLEPYKEGHSKITYTINKVTETQNKDEVILNVTTKVPDLQGAMQESMKKAVEVSIKMKGKSEAEIEAETKKVFLNLIKEKLQNPNLKFREETYDVVMIKKGFEWEPHPDKNPSLMNMLLLYSFN